MMLWNRKLIFYPLLMVWTEIQDVNASFPKDQDHDFSCLLLHSDVPVDQVKIGGFIAACRKQAGFTQAALAERLGVTDRAVSKWENAVAMPDISLLPLLAEAISMLWQVDISRCPRSRSLNEELAHARKSLEAGIVDFSRCEKDTFGPGGFESPEKLLRWLEDNQQYLKDGALLTDVTGIKGPVVYKVQAMLRPALEFVGAHPMAGREVYGVRNADCSIFQGANYIVTPTESNTPAAVETTEELGRLLGFARISRLSPERHDEMIGFLSQLTHCIAVALMNSKESRHLAEFTGDSFRDLTRIARINDGMWSELFLLNRDELLSQMDLFIGKFGELRDALAAGDMDKMREMMRISTERRSYFDRK